MAHNVDLITRLAVSRGPSAITRLERERSLAATKDRPEPPKLVDAGDGDNQGQYRRLARDVVVAVEDSSAGITAAKAAGLPVLAVDRDAFDLSSLNESTAAVSVISYGAPGSLIASGLEVRRRWDLSRASVGVVVDIDR